MERLILTNQSNRIECTVVNSPFAKLSLWHYRELLLETIKTRLEHLLPPYQFGQFTCQFTGGSNSLLVREKGKNSIHSSTYIDAQLFTRIFAAIFKYKCVV